MAYGVIIWAYLIWLFFTRLAAFLLRVLSETLASRKRQKRAVAFFHPYTNDGGGGERVVWCAVRAVQKEVPDLDVVVYTGDHDSSSESLVARAVDRFGVRLLHPAKGNKMGAESEDADAGGELKMFLSGGFILKRLTIVFLGLIWV